MKTKILASLLMASMLAISMFAALKFAYASPAAVDLINLAYPVTDEHVNFTCEAYNPLPDPAPRTTIKVGILVKDIVNVSMWDVIVRWNPTVLAPNDTNFVNFNPDSPGSPYDPYGGMPESTGHYSLLVGDSGVVLGQTKDTQYGVDLPYNITAWIVLKVKYPGISRVWIDYETFLEDDYTPIAVTISTPYENPCWYWSHTPVPVWYQNATGHTLPSKTCKIDSHSVEFGDYVMFNGTDSWDPDGDTITSYEWFYGDGYYSNDIRLTNYKVGGFPIGRAEDMYYRAIGTVNPGDPDICTPLVPFVEQETHVDTVPNGLYDMGEAIVWDMNGDFNYSVADGDYVIAYGPVAEFTELVPFLSTIGCGSEWPREKHCDNEALDGLYTPYEDIYEDRDGPHDEDYSHVSAGQVIMYHQYLDYRKEAYHAWLGIWDNNMTTPLYWRSDWYQQMGEHDIWIWRDVAIVDLWPTLDILDNVHQFWEWDALQNEEFALGMYGGILVTLPNYGSIAEFVHVELYAIWCEFTAWYYYGWQYDGNVEYYVIEEWLYEIGPNTGSGFDLFACWTPPKKGAYILVCKVDVVPCTHGPVEYGGAKIDDFYGMSFWEEIWMGMPNEWTEWADPSDNNFYTLNKPLYVFDDTEEYAIWLADINKDGIVYDVDLDAWGRVWYKTWG